MDREPYYQRAARVLPGTRATLDASGLFERLRKLEPVRKEEG